MKYLRITYRKKSTHQNTPGHPDPIRVAGPCQDICDHGAAAVGPHVLQTPRQQHSRHPRVR